MSAAVAIQWPTLAEVEKADRVQLARWFRFLPASESNDQTAVVSLMFQRFGDMGGMTPEISKEIGWGKK